MASLSPRPLGLPPVINEDGVCFVVPTGDRFEVKHVNRLGPDDMCMATPALAGDRLVIRTANRVYCLRQKQQ